MPTDAESSESTGPTLAIDEDGLSINEVYIRLPTDSSPLNQFLGSPRWMTHSYFWDEYGITACGKSRDQLTWFMVAIHEGILTGEHPNQPRHAFTGKLLIGGFPITSETKIQNIVANKRGVKLKEQYGDSWVAGEQSMVSLFGESYIRLITLPDETVSCVQFSRRSGLFKQR